jgi:hypothetical protein
MFTLIDITETHARRGDDKFRIHQQQNYQSVIQTIGIRANPIIINSSSSMQDVSAMSFGYKGNHKLWKLSFEFDLTDAHSIEQLIEDMHMIPIIPELDETIKTNAFYTKDHKINTVFSLVQ